MNPDSTHVHMKGQGAEDSLRSYWQGSNLCRRGKVEGLFPTYC